MDIKPFNQPVPDFWTSLDVVSLIFIGGAALALVVLVLSIFVDYLRDMVSSLIIVFLILSMFGVISGIGDLTAKHRSNYENAVTELNKHLADDGFKMVSGTPDLRPNTQSSMLISYEGKSFDCTMFSPKDSNTSVVFSCGEAKLTLSEVKNNVSR